VRQSPLPCIPSTSTSPTRYAASGSRRPSCGRRKPRSGVIIAIEMNEEAEVYDDDDLRLGDGSGATPDRMKSWTERKLFFCQVQNGGGQYSRLAEGELSRRRNNELKTHIRALNKATDSVKEATLGVETEVGKLAASSEILENLTRKLITLTNWLIGLAILAVIVPIAIELWKITQPERPVQVIVQYPPQTAPQTPSQLPLGSSSAPWEQERSRQLRLFM
jgi:hypothetical protein